MHDSKQYPPVVVVDENDHEVGFAMLDTVWERGLYHRIVSVFVVDIEENMLLQLRGPRVKVYPNCWDQAAGGHVDKGSTYQLTATNEILEELGASILPEDFIELGTHRINVMENDKLINQFERVYLLQIPRSTKLRKQTEEVSLLKWFSPSELRKQATQKPEIFTPGLLNCLKAYFPSYGQ